MSNNNSTYRGREYYYQDTHTAEKIQQLQNKDGESHESYQYTNSEPNSNSNFNINVLNRDIQQTSHNQQSDTNDPWSGI